MQVGAIMRKVSKKRSRTSQQYKEKNTQEGKKVIGKL